MTLDAWRDISNPATRKIACVGDSTTEIGWAAILRDLATQRWGYGGYGVRPMNKEWAQSGTPTKAGGSDAWEVGFVRSGASPNCGTWRLNTATDIFTWTKPNDCPAITGFKLLMGDGPSSANFSYSIDGGAYTNVSGTWTQNNSLRQITINTPVNSTVAVRGANAAGTAVLTYICGIEPLCATTGVKVHDISASGGFSNHLIRTGDAGDWTQWFLQEQPQLVFMNFINDMTFWTGGLPAAFQQRYDDFGAFITGYGGTVVYYRYFEWVGPSTVTQDDAGARIYAVAQKYGGLFYDLKAIHGNFAAVSAAGIIGSDNTHPTPKGSRLMANHAWNHAGRLLTPKKLVRP
jgi:lysophospholipase L1-like esterase